MRNSKLQWIVTILILGAILTMVSAPMAASAAQGGNPDKLSKHDRELLAEARANGEETVTLLIASLPGKNRSVASSVEALGGTIRYREDSIDYLRVLVPTGQVEVFAEINGIQAVDLDEIIPLEDPRPDTGEGAEGVVGVIPQPAPNASTPRTNPYMPTQDIGAAQFVDANPTWDGRGVVVGILDSGITLDQSAGRNPV